MTTKVLLGKDEIRSLKTLVEKLIFWDYRSTLRIQIKNSNIGLFGSTPFNCLAFLALPLQKPNAEIDLVINAGEIAKQLKDENLIELLLIDSNKPAPELALLPPTGPWMPGEKGIAGDILPIVKSRLEKLKAQIEPLEMLASDTTRDSVTETAWNENLWGGIPFGALNVAAAIGMLTFPGARVNAATCQGWKRFVTPSGQVFVRPQKAVRTLLSVVK
ncbi:MAG: hypothetical protein NWP59_00725 [Candidatus Nanopelagicales bacterium]|nr:hypothetical protein [Candidatus Nanopelagicales bacterium]MDP4986484.1 hypothetical protein [Candidatus Nanopelagicales bacterium]MDP5107469.1 hypothetical protein [Candidatus Nanopelagicales bacterium]